ncbi:MAG: hypothetical protein R6W70_03315, partial [bacterium]
QYTCEEFHKETVAKTIRGTKVSFIHDSIWNVSADAYYFWDYRDIELTKYADLLFPNVNSVVFERRGFYLSGARTDRQYVDCEKILLDARKHRRKTIAFTPGIGEKKILEKIEKGNIDYPDNIYFCHLDKDDYSYYRCSIRE